MARADTVHSYIPLNQTVIKVDRQRPRLQNNTGEPLGMTGERSCNRIRIGRTYPAPLECAITVNHTHMRRSRNLPPASRYRSLSDTSNPAYKVIGHPPILERPSDDSVRDKRMAKSITQCPRIADPPCNVGFRLPAMPLTSLTARWLRVCNAAEKCVLRLAATTLDCYLRK